MKVLFIGDIVASPGREVVAEILPDLKTQHSIDFVVANADNLAHGRGATENTIREMQSVGVDYFTGGDHIFWHKGFKDIIDSLPVLRPANYPRTVPGIGHKLVDLGEKGTVLLISLLGRTFLNDKLENPFTIAEEILDSYKDETITATFIDFHAEATTEKYALGLYLDGKIDALIGTHTHVPTCDNIALPKGTLFVSDVGMTGIIDSALGVKKEIIWELYLTAHNQRFEWEKTGRKAFRSVLLNTEEKSIERLDFFDV